MYKKMKRENKRLHFFPGPCKILGLGAWAQGHGSSASVPRRAGRRGHGPRATLGGGTELYGSEARGVGFFRFKPRSLEKFLNPIERVLRVRPDSAIVPSPPCSGDARPDKEAMMAVWCEYVPPYWTNHLMGIVAELN